MQTDIAHTPLITYYSLLKSTPVLKFIVGVYFPILGLDIFESLFDVLPDLSFAESLVYKMDKIVEDGQENNGGKYDISSEEHQAIVCLKAAGLFNEEVEKHLNGVLTYYRNETTCVVEPISDFNFALRTWEQRSHDLRMLGEIIALKFNKTIKPEVKDAIDEIFLFAEVVYDIKDYAKDVRLNQFSMIRMYAKHYGAEAKVVLEQKMEELKSNVLKIEFSQEDRDRVLKVAQSLWDRYNGIPEIIPEN
jgi:hypothetical protein